MKRTMKAYQIVEWQQPPQVREVEVPEPGQGEILVKVAGNGLCHSDFNMQAIPKETAEYLGWQLPFTLGHETGGWIEKLGDGVENLAIGEPLALVSPNSCGVCEYCIRGEDNNCIESAAGRGYGRDGGLAEYVLVKSSRFIIKLNKLDPLQAGPLTDAGATSYHAVKRVLTRLTPGSSVVVIGAGGLGSFAIQFLKQMTAARIIAVDMNPSRLDLAREYGAHETLIGVTESTASEIRTLTGCHGAAAVLDFAGFDATIEAGLASLRKGGSYGLVGAGGGTFKKPWIGNLPQDGEVFNFQGGTIADVQEVFAMAEAGLIKSEIDVFPFSQITEAYEKLHHGGMRGRAVIIPDHQ
ncbi:NAD(P)-dependent alcohol dehydrogenase [Lysinibacillus sp. G4S2]|uniref:NAD(P)-dependent alcohol dehydrogenase n=1 Tax=Lysinibacillus sp. G4S2 TaxID=3055859 RepID=UPI0025A2F4E1|nr:NAD(P)-dependent alcohol dehydrogenase [Lysinibacillus sp. G4S2]MDM5248664.1 NAD(P)-dependent alcohol dehydrogenase [Lysinibacillus sp. G4S2]